MTGTTLRHRMILTSYMEDDAHIVPVADRENESKRNNPISLLDSRLAGGPGDCGTGYHW